MRITFKEAKVTKTVLKLGLGIFDLESIRILNLHNSGISDLGCIEECIGLEKLDISDNNITELHTLASLSRLQTLNVSSNRVCSLGTSGSQKDICKKIEGLQSLENLQSLDVAGNLISKLSSLRRLCGLDNLTELRLKDDAHKPSNAVCTTASYVNDVLYLLPSLLVLDGQRVRGQGSDLFALCQEIDHALQGIYITVSTHLSRGQDLKGVYRQANNYTEIHLRVKLSNLVDCMVCLKGFGNRIILAVRFGELPQPH